MTQTETLIRQVRAVMEQLPKTTRATISDRQTVLGVIHDLEREAMRWLSEAER